MLELFGCFYCKKDYYYVDICVFKVGCLYRVYDLVHSLNDDFYHIFNDIDDVYCFIKKDVFLDYFVSECVWLRKCKLLKLSESCF